jgi:DNA-binding CsgD family transcriptional regulator
VEKVDKLLVGKENFVKKFSFFFALEKETFDYWLFDVPISIGSRGVAIQLLLSFLTPAKMSDDEILRTHQRQAERISRLLKKSEMSLEEIGLLSLSQVALHRLSDFKPLYLNEAGLRFVDMTWEEIESMSAEEYLQKYLSPYSQKHVLPDFQAYLQKGDFRKVHSVFQHLWSSREGEYVWVYSTTKVMTQQRILLSLSTPVREMGAMAPTIERSLEAERLRIEGRERLATLTEREREVFQCIIAGQSRSAISRSLGITLNTYDTHRNRIRRKLDLHNLADWMRFASRMGMLEE